MTTTNDAVRSLGERIAHRMSFYAWKRAVDDSSKLFEIVLKPEFWDKFSQFAKTEDKSAINHYILGDMVDNDKDGCDFKMYAVHIKPNVFSELAKLIAASISNTTYWGEDYSTEMVFGRDDFTRKVIDRFDESLKGVVEIRYTFETKLAKSDIKENKTNAKISLNFTCTGFTYDLV